MTDDRRKRYENHVRQRNAGVLPWVTDKDLEKKEHPIFSKNQETKTQEGHRACPLPENFEPEKAFLELLWEYHGIPIEYTLKQLVEFKLYWRETGEVRKAWQNKFKNHVIYRWKRGQDDEAGKRTHRTTAEKLTDRSWAEGLGFDDRDDG